MSDKFRAYWKGQRTTLDKKHVALLEQNSGAIWIHAASVGEFEQARPLIEKLKANGEKRKIVVTFFSPSGYEARKNYELADGVYYLPLPTRRNAKRLIKILQPSMAIFVKYEFWPAYIRELKKRGIPTYSICAIFRPKQYFFRWWGHGQLKVLRSFTHLFVQNEASRELLAKHGVTNVSVAGDTRFDRMAAVRANGERTNGEKLTPVAQFTDGCEQVIVAGSTWPEDEALLAQYMENARMMNERVKLRGAPALHLQPLPGALCHLLCTQPTARCVQSGQPPQYPAARRCAGSGYDGLAQFNLHFRTRGIHRRRIRRRNP